MNDSIKIALAQINPLVGDLQGNYLKIASLFDKAQKADIIVTPELAITGYPSEDLLLNRNFQKKAMQQVEKLAELTKNSTSMIVGGIKEENGLLYNAAFFLSNGKIEQVILKHNLPNYGVFDEKRIFTQGSNVNITNYHGIKLGVMICEDIWVEEVIEQLAQQQAEIIIAINASPFETKKYQIRQDLISKHIEKFQLPVIYLNNFGGQDNLIFDGGSFIFNYNGKLAVQLDYFAESFFIANFKKNSNKWHIEEQFAEKIISEEEFIYKAAMLGVRDYIHKNGFSKVILGLSGGIDSALTAAIAVDALGKNNVWAVMMPSVYTSAESIIDAQKLAANLGIKLDNIPINECFNAFKNSLAPIFLGKDEDITEENLQARTRGMLLMSISNKYHSLLLSTGNKSELAVGYTTLYGDMCGAYNPLKDIYKTQIYKISNWRNNNLPSNAVSNQINIIPENIINKAPSAELKHNQKDQDSLPEYELLDNILNKLIEEHLSVEEIVEQGYERITVEKVAKLLYLAEYKRRQAPIGAKISSKCFGIDRRYPITNKWNNI